MHRVKDIRKAFRRRYASRTNIQKIFEEYDHQGKGYINAYDLIKQAERLGLGVSINEAQTLIQSA